MSSFSIPSNLPDISAGALQAIKLNPITSRQVIIYKGVFDISFCSVEI